MTFQKIAELIRTRWTDAVVEDHCIIITVAEAGQPIVVRISHSEVTDEVGFVIDVIGAEEVPVGDLFSTLEELGGGSLVNIDNRMLLCQSVPCASFVDVDVLRFVRALVERAAALRARWTGGRAAA